MTPTTFDPEPHFDIEDLAFLIDGDARADLDVPEAYLERPDLFDTEIDWS